MTTLSSPFARAKKDSVMNAVLNPNLENFFTVSFFGAAVGTGIGVFKQLNNPGLTNFPGKMITRYTLKYGGFGAAIMGAQMLTSNITDNAHVIFGAGLFAAGLFLGVRKGQLANGIAYGVSFGFSGLTCSYFMTEEWLDGRYQKTAFLGDLQKHQQVREHYSNKI
eukprot:NODE_63_length_26141_cov_1.022656.p20 type:complete len:165 gc:universal NODE_63_length_26141_cov_1.022656:12041-12535(+)